jgi:exosome complex component CSL4
MTVVPGERIGAVEEYMPAEGTFSSDDSVYSSKIGELLADRKTHSAKVASKTRKFKIQGVGDVTIGEIAEATEMVAIVDLAEIDDDHNSLVPNGNSAVLHVSNITQSYVEDLRAEVKIGDIIRARIIEVTPGTTKLSIASKELGVIKAFCSVCRQPLRQAGPKLVCDRCGSVEHRKTAEDYGSGKLR